MSRKPARAFPQLRDTAAVLSAFVETGSVDAQPVETPAVSTAGRPSGRASGRLDGNMHGSADEHADDMAVIRAARAAKERPPERTVKTTVRLPENVATELRVVAIREGVTMADITTGILRSWLGRYRGEM